MKNIVRLLLAVLLMSSNIFGQSRIDTLIKITNIETSYPSWSPDGSMLVVQSNRMDDDSEIYLMSDSGVGIQRLTNNPGLDEYPAFSPNGKKIAFVSQKDDNQEVYLMDLNGNNQENLSRHPQKDIHPQFSPDGKSIIFNSNRAGNFDIYLMTLSNRQTTQLTSSPNDETYAHWSPDGKQIVYVKWLEEQGKANGELFIYDLNDRSEVRLTNNPAFDGWPSWADDGKKVIFASNRHNRKDFQIYTIDSDGSNVVKLTSGEEENATFTKPVYARDGSSRVACTRTKEGNVEVFVFTIE